LCTGLGPVHQEARHVCKDAAQAREEAATLRGRLQALETILDQHKAKAVGVKNT